MYSKYKRRFLQHMKTQIWTIFIENIFSSTIEDLGCFFSLSLSFFPSSPYDIFLIVFDATL